MYYLPNLKEKKWKCLRHMKRIQTQLNWNKNKVKNIEITIIPNTIAYQNDLKSSNTKYW